MRTAEGEGINAKGDDRINWRFLKEHYPRWRKKDTDSGRFGSDLMSLILVCRNRAAADCHGGAAEWCMDIFNVLELNLKYFDEIWNAGYEFDCIRWRTIWALSTAFLSRYLPRAFKPYMPKR